MSRTLSISRLSCAAVAAMLLATSVASANNVVYSSTTYEVKPAHRTHTPNSGGHVFWLPGSGLPNGGNSTFLAKDAPLELLVEDHGPGGYVAYLTGTIQSVGDPTSMWDVDFVFHENDSRTPKRELHSSNYVENMGPIDPSIWIMFDIHEATFKGLGVNNGVEIDVAQKGLDRNYGFQLGDGANGKNLSYGMSGWLMYEYNDGTHRGDLNVDLCEKNDTPEIPTPAALPAGLAMLGLAVARRRRR